LERQRRIPLGVALVVTRRTVLFSAVGGGLIVAAGSALANPLRWIGLGDRSWVWLLLMSGGLGVLSFTCLGQARATPGLRRLPLALAASVLLMAALLATGSAVLRLAFGDSEQRVVAASSDGRFEIVVHETSNVIDPVQGLYVQTTSGPFSRRAYLGCVNSESGESVESAHFRGAGTVVFEGSRQWTVRFDPEQVRAIDSLEAGACARQLYTGS
jgi:hypothetical protein